MSIQLLPEILPGQPGTGHDGWVVIVYNNAHNTYDEVIDILMQATSCGLDEAEMETWEVDHLGKSVVHQGEQEECERAAAVIRTIGIQVEVKQE
jgi:ATP-dependent Clp protease adapter protein ClpS